VWLLTVVHLLRGCSSRPQSSHQKCQGSIFTIWCGDICQHHLTLVAEDGSVDEIQGIQLYWLPEDISNNSLHKLVSNSPGHQQWQTWQSVDALRVELGNSSYRGPCLSATLLWSEGELSELMVQVGSLFSCLWIDLRVQPSSKRSFIDFICICHLWCSTSSK